MFDWVKRLFEGRATKVGTGHPRTSQVQGDPMAGIIHVFGTRTDNAAGQPVDEYTAMHYAPVIAATRLLATSVACLRLELLEDGNRANPSKRHPIARLMNVKPNRWQNAYNFRTWAVAQQVNLGNAYAEIQRSRGGAVEALKPIHANHVKVERDGEDVTYLVREPERKWRAIGQDDMFHVASDINDGLMCTGMIELLTESIGMGLATEQHGASFFGNGAVPEGLLKHPGTLSPEARRNLRSEWKKKHVGKREVGILWEGMDYVQTTISPEQAQFLETRKYNAEVIAQAYRVPQHMIGILDRSSFNNIEVQSREFVRYSLLHWLKAWEHEIMTKLLSQRAQDSLVAKFNTDEFELVELESRTRAMNDLWMHGGITLDERRQREGLDPYNIPGVSDTPFVPLNIAPAETAVKQLEEDEQPPEPPPMDEEDGDGDEMDVIASATRTAVVDTMKRMAANEANAAKRAAKKPAEFFKWLDDFYGRHRAKLLDAIAPTVTAWQLSQREAPNAQEITHAWCADSRQQLLDAADGDPKEFEKRVAAVVSKWQQRAETIGGEGDRYAA